MKPTITQQNVITMTVSEDDYERILRALSYGACYLRGEVITGTNESAAIVFERLRSELINATND